MLQSHVSKLVGILGTLLLVSALPALAQAQTGQVTGRVTSQDTGQPLGAVQVFLDGIGRGSITRADGTYLIVNVPPGTYTIVAQSVGHRQFRQAGVNVEAEASAAVNIQLEPTVLALQEVVVTGLVDPTEGVRSPITVSTVTREQMPVVPTGQATAMLQGSVAGVTRVAISGQPGSSAPIILRTPTSARGDNTPLIVVDGVILGESTVDIESMDVESIEVIKGAAAASLYGSRAASGVIAITTGRGRHLAAGQTQFMARTEIGHSQPATVRGLPTHHQFEVDAEGYYVDRQGNRTNRAGRWAPPIAFMDKPYPPGTELYDNLRAIYRPGNFNTQNFQIAQNAENTNFSMSLNRYVERGSLVGNDGYLRNAVRLNLDHRFLDNISLGISAYHSRAYRDNIISGVSFGGPFQDMLITPPDIDLARKDENGNYIQAPDPQVPFENPIWRQISRENETDRNRTLGNANLRWSPVGWFTAVADVSYDREDSGNRIYVPKGTPLSVTVDNPSDGSLSYTMGFTDTFNASLQGSIRRDFGALNARTTVRGLVETRTDQSVYAQGQDFNVFGVPRINATLNRNSTSSFEEIRALGYLWDTAFDYDGKYIATVLVRRDGSSLFGPDNRWHNYYRGAFAYRMSEEPWFNIANVDEFKLRFSRGTAGGRPAYSAQYETWSVGATSISKGTLGNRDLRPEHTTEHEFGLDMILFGRLGVEIVHARQETTDQLINAPVPANTGYNSQWINSGAMAGHTTEVRVESRVLNRPNLTWSTTLVGDRSRSKVTDWPQPCVTDFVSITCEGNNIRDIWTLRWIATHDELPAELQPYRDQFQFNDEGYLVWVGEGNSWRDGIGKNLWGTTATLGGHSLGWGLPFLEKDEYGADKVVRTGNGDAEFQAGWLNNVRYGNFSFYTHMHASVGNQLINMTRQYLNHVFRQPEQDQGGKPDELKKPLHYYGHLYANARYVNTYLEDASYLKLRAVSVNYRFGQEQLNRFGIGRMGASGLSVGVIARNIFTITPYSGFDPETANGGRAIPFDYYNYPHTRNLTASVELTF